MSRRLDDFDEWAFGDRYRVRGWEKMLVHWFRPMMKTTSKVSTSIAKLQDGGKPKHFRLSYFAPIMYWKGLSPFVVRYYSTLLSSSLKLRRKEGDALWCTVYPECFDGHSSMAKVA